MRFRGFNGYDALGIAFGMILIADVSFAPWNLLMVAIAVISWVLMMYASHLADEKRK